MSNGRKQLATRLLSCKSGQPGVRCGQQALENSLPIVSLFGSLTKSVVNLSGPFYDFKNSSDSLAS